MLWVLTQWKRLNEMLPMSTHNKCDFQQCDILTSVHSDKHVQPPIKLRNSLWCSVSSLTVIEYSK